MLRGINRQTVFEDDEDIEKLKNLPVLHGDNYIRTGPGVHRRYFCTVYTCLRKQNGLP